MLTAESFKELCASRSWQQAFSDDCRGGDWQASWFLDGDAAKVENTPEGMVLTAGSNINDNGDSMVLWTKEEFVGDIKVEYDYTRLDALERNVNIIYLHATGKGGEPYVEDIAQWSELRRRAAMSKYFLNMNALHISYAVNRFDVEGEYVRARRYPVPEGGSFEPDTEIEGTYFDTKLWKPGVKYRMTIIKHDERMYMHVAGDGRDELFQWDLTAFPPVTHGRIGLRQMSCRKALYSDFRVSSLKS